MLANLQIKINNRYNLLVDSSASSYPSGEKYVR